MFIITNTTMGGEYTPSKANTFEEAKAWLFECTANNIPAWQEGEHEELSDMSDVEILEWASENLDVKFNDWGSEIWYDDDSYNIMNIYDLDKI